MAFDEFLKKLEKQLAYLQNDPFATEKEIEDMENTIRAYKKLS